MKLDNWLAQRSQSCPDRIALVADGRRRSTYAELEAEATWVARRLAAHGVRRGSTAALTMHPRREQVVLIHALMKLGARAAAAQPAPRPPPSGAAIVAAEEPIVDLDDPGQLTQTEADLPLLGEHDMDDICCRILTSGRPAPPHPVGLTYGNHLWSAVGSAFNIGVDPEDRWLCCVPLSHISGLSIVMRSVIYGTDRGRSTTASTSTGSRAALERGRRSRVVSLVTTMLTRLLDAGADLSRPAGDPGRRRPGARSEPLEEALGRGATVVQTYGLTETCSQVTTLAPGRRPAQARLRRPAAAHHPPADPATARSSSRARPSPPAAPTPTAGCTPATSAGSTRTASSTSRTGSTT